MVDISALDARFDGAWARHVQASVGRKAAEHHIFERGARHGSSRRAVSHGASAGMLQRCVDCKRMVERVL